MKESFYQWVKTLAVFYILFSAVLHLIPDPKYERYIRSFMGLLLIFILCISARKNSRQFAPPPENGKNRKCKIGRAHV